VLLHPRQRDVEGVSELGDARVRAPEPLENPTPGGVGQGSEGSVELRLILNHMVQYNGFDWLVNSPALRFLTMIETQSLRLIPYAPEQILALINQPERFEDLAGFPAAPGLRDGFVSDEVSAGWLAELRKLGHPDPWQLGFALLHRDSGSVIGSAGFKGPPDADGVVEVAYGIVPAFQGFGYATEATQALVAFAFANDVVERVRAHTLPAQSASTRVLTKCGFTRVGNVIDPDDGPVWRWERIG